MALLRVPPVSVPAQKGVGKVLLVNVSDLRAADPKPHPAHGGRPFYMLDDEGLMFGCNLVCPKSGKRAV